MVYNVTMLHFVELTRNRDYFFHLVRSRSLNWTDSHHLQLTRYVNPSYVLHTCMQIRYQLVYRSVWTLMNMNIRRKDKLFSCNRKNLQIDLGPIDTIIPDNLAKASH